MVSIYLCTYVLMRSANSFMVIINVFFFEQHLSCFLELFILLDGLYGHDFDKLLLCSDIWRQSKSAMQNVKMDIHAKLMKNYKEVPQWWFLVLLLGSVALSLLMSFVWKKDVQLPWWGMLFAFGLAWFITLPIGVIQATTNQVFKFTIIIGSMHQVFSAMLMYQEKEKKKKETISSNF